jgi:hypothetical protein
MYGLSSIWVAFHIPYSIRPRMEYGVWIESLLPVIYTFVFAALFTRAVLVYELNGLARKTTVENEKMPREVDAEAKDLLCVNCIPLNQRDMEE